MASILSNNFLKSNADVCDDTATYVDFINVSAIRAPFCMNPFGYFDVLIFTLNILIIYLLISVILNHNPTHMNTIFQCHHSEAVCSPPRHGVSIKERKTNLKKPP
jgi:hypothetical protein